MWLTEAIEFKDNVHRAPLGSPMHLHLVKVEKQRQITELSTQYTEGRTATAALEEHMTFQVDEDLRKRRWIRDVLKKHGPVTHLHSRQGEIEPWNSVEHTEPDYSGDDVHREGLSAQEDRFPEEDPEVRYVTLTFEESSGLILVIAPEATTYFQGDKFEDALNLMETLEPMDTRSRTLELLTLESMQYCVNWTIEEQDPLWSVLMQIKYPKSYLASGYAS